jgi:hexosaminidase
MKRKIIVFVLCIAFFKGYTQEYCPIIPLPEKVEKSIENFALNRTTVIVFEDEQIKRIGDYLQSELLRSVQIPLSTSNKKAANEIVLLYSKAVPNVIGAYKLAITKNKVTISGRDNEGIFNGVVSFLQLVSSTKKVNNVVNVAGWQITDQPQYNWRGLMLDESRHFFGKKKVKQTLDWMAFYKLNRFHWHLTDQHGWRIEIKQYPKLTTVGGIGNYSNENAPASYYTQEDIKEIVSYAAERFIQVIPEIDMPGHASAANRAYPEFSGGGSKQFPEFTFNPGKESTYQYLTNILRETDVMFPSQMIHIGGDEVHYGNEKWNTDGDIKQLMEKEKLNDLKAVENYFFKRMADSLLLIGNKVLAWDEVAESNLPKNETIVFWWRHNKPEQLQKSLDKGFSVVLSPRSPMYFDYKQDSLQVHGPDWKKFSLNSTENVYHFNPEKIPVVFPKNNLVLGIQANVWTERIVTEQRLDYMMYPRIAALAEAAWTKNSSRNYKQFLLRLKDQFPLYKKSGLYYFDLTKPDLTGEPKE